MFNYQIVTPKEIICESKHSKIPWPPLERQAALVIGISLIGVAYKQRPCSWGWWQISQPINLGRKVPLDFFYDQTSNLICCSLPFTSSFVLNSKILSANCSKLAGEIPETLLFVALYGLLQATQLRHHHKGLKSMNQSMGYLSREIVSTLVSQ